MSDEEVIIIGAGPCGLSCALALKKRNINPLIIEKACIVNTIHRFPTHQTFFSSSNRLEIGDIPFITERHKPVRNDALTYYREVARRQNLRINSYEEVREVKKQGNRFIVDTLTHKGKKNTYKASHVIVATGYYDTPHKMNVQGEELQKVMHYFKEAHPYYEKDLVVIGGKNSAVDAALELKKAGAHVTILYRGATYSKSIKPWILPQLDSLIKEDKIKMKFNATVTRITNDAVFYDIEGEKGQLENDFVFAMTGYEPNLSFLRQIGLKIDEESGKPFFNEATFETNLKNLYVAGVVISGYNTSETFIENGRLHGDSIAQSILENKNQSSL